ncbi:hypothetical protein MKX03_002125 [Papaver bracteatum]|nr:hypothetical protein MKX03_002125 [Papaver bracteatum]
MAHLILYGAVPDKNVFKALIVAEYSGVEIELVKDFAWGVTNKTPEFLQMNPIGKFCKLVCTFLFCFVLSVARLKEGNPLLGSSLIEYVEEAAIAGLKRALTALNSYLASNTYLVGHCVTLADIIMTCNLSMGFSRLLTKSFTQEFPHVERYFWTMVNQPNIAKLFGEVKQTESVPPIQSAKEVPEQDEAPKPKAENPLDLLPPSTMILDEWKRLYSNTKTNFREVAIKARKYAFGKMLIIGSEAPFKVKGLWLFRGPEIPQFIMDECYDMELYEWTKVDIADENQKERVNQMIEDQEPFEGEALLDANCFK